MGLRRLVAASCSRSPFCWVQVDLRAAAMCAKNQDQGKSSVIFYAENACVIFLLG